MGKSTPQAPAPPDPYKTAQAQTGSNVNTAVANSWLSNANEVGPTGSVTYTPVGYHNIGGAPGGGSVPFGGMGGAGAGIGESAPGVMSGTLTPGDGGARPGAAPDYGGGGTDGGGFTIPQFQRTVTLSPEQQQLYNQQTQLGGDLNKLAIDQTGKLSNILGQPIDSSGLPARGQLPGSAPTGPTGPTFGMIGGQGPIQQSVNFQQSPTTFGAAGDIQRSIGPTDYSADRTKVEDALYSRINPQLERDRAALETNLVNQGFARGSEAFNTQMDQFGRQANDARNQAILAGGQEQSRLAGLALQGGAFANQAQQQAYGQEAGRGEFAQQGTQANNQNALAGGQFANTAQQQAFDQAMAGTGFNNAALQQGYGNEAARQQQQFANQTALAQGQDTSRERALQETLSLRNQPINEISSLMSGGQVSMPQFAQYQGGQVAGTPIGQYLYDTAGLNQQNYNTQLASQTAKQNALLGGLAGLGGAGLYGLAGGKFKLPGAVT